MARVVLEKRIVRLCDFAGMSVLAMVRFGVV
jgi:hypothetical protein